MHHRDHTGLFMTGANGKALDSFHAALTAYHCYAGDAPTMIEDALTERPDFTMAHILKAYMNLLGGTADQIVVGMQAYDAAQALPANEREQGHLAAITALLQGQLRTAGRILEDVAIAHPRDALALQAGHLVDFLRGDSRMLRDRIARAMLAWAPDMPSYHAMLGMLSFGLEETGHYDRAEAMGRKAVELEPRNGWAQHAVAHVLEMQDRRAEGVAWMRRDVNAWTHESFFAIHNWWHLALYHLGLGEIEEVLALYDGPIFGPRSDAAFDLLDAAALLWRLNLRGVDVGHRWTDLADIYARRGGFGGYAFDDYHAVIAFIGAGRQQEAEAVLRIQSEVLAAPIDNAEYVRDVGLPLIEGLIAFGRGDYRTCIDRLRLVRNGAARFGGSHAQRDLIDLTLIEAAGRDRQHGLAKALWAERAAAKPLAKDQAAPLTWAA